MRIVIAALLLYLFMLAVMAACYTVQVPEDKGWERMVALNTGRPYSPGT
jgi:hypothetical protein